LQVGYKSTPGDYNPKLNTFKICKIFQGSSSMGGYSTELKLDVDDDIDKTLHIKVKLL
jgi:hypothetical protein